MKKIWRSMTCILMAGCLLLGISIVSVAAEPYEEKGDVTPSDTAYSMIMTNAYDTFIYNEKPVDMSIGKKYYMVYTVDEISTNELSLSGVSIAKDGNQEYPYTDGTLKYYFDTRLFEEGATYFCRMEVTEQGLSYVVAKKGLNESEWIELPLTATSQTEDCKFFGIWLGERVSAKLSNILCYDEKGNDLGVITHSRSGSCAIYDASILKEKSVGQWYDFSLVDAWNLAISNERPTESDTVYISYTVENVKQNKANQAGVGHSDSPKAQYPHASGILNFNFVDSSPLLEEGAKYLICAQSENGILTVIVKKTVNGKEDIFSFPIHTGKASDDARFFYLWFGEGVKYGVTADIKNFRFYDKTGKNLGVQTNQSNITITKHGDIEDYSLCEAVYWCEENNTTLILDDEQNIGVKDESGSVDTKWYKYKVRGAKLTMQTEQGEVVYDYQYSFAKDSDGNKYIRLNDTKVTFVTGIREHEGNKTVDVTAADGYKVEKPEDPKVDGYTFKEWCYADGTSFDFERYVTDSVTVYAKYLDGDAHEYIVVTDDVNINGNVKKYEVLGVALSGGLILLTAVGVCFIIIKGKKRNGK